MSTPSTFRARQPEPYRVDVGYLAAFFVVLALLGGVGYHIYSTTRVNVSQIEWPDPLSMGRTKTEQRLVSAVGDLQAPLVIPTATATVVRVAPASFGQAAAPAEAQAQPQATATPRVPPSAIPLAALERAITNPNDVAPAKPAEAAAPAAAQATPAAVPAQGRLKIANTGGDGVYVRRTPRLADRAAAWPDNTPMEFLGETAEGEGLKWSKVQDPRGNVGWVPSQYLVPDASAPAAPALAGPVRPGPATAAQPPVVPATRP